VSHPADLVRWGRALFDGQAMSTPYLHELYDAVPVDGPAGLLSYGAGIAIRRGGAFGPVLGHAGSIPGYLSSLRYYPEIGAVIAFQMNTDGPFTGGLDAGEVMSIVELALVRHLAPGHDG
jgi:D-alanyl-D-alanine carboxypeptidase